MSNLFNPAWEALHQTANSLIAANEGIKRVADAALAASSEHEDLRETVERLESCVDQQSEQIAAQTNEIRRLRERLDDGRS